MSELEALKNRGLCTLGPPPSAGDRTVVVVGVARGGTSIVAGALAKLGVFMGDEAVPPVFEDVRLAKAIDDRQWAEVRAIIAEYDERYPVWGFKRPSATPHLATLDAMFRNPVYVVVFRDVLAIANRNAISMKTELVPSLSQALDGFAQIVSFLQRGQVSALLVSVEKVMLHKKAFLDRLVEYLCLRDEVTPERRQQAADFIAPDPPSYLETSRLRFLGHVDRVTKRFVAGWAWIRNQEQPAVLRVSINGAVVGKIEAARMRPDVRQRTAHPTGKCGFRFEFPRDRQPRVGDEVAVQFEVGGEHLKWSPRLVEQAPS